MKNLFPGHYRPTQEQFETMWKTATIVPDTNVILNFYRYSSDTRDRLLGILRKYRERIWLPHQAAKEFHANRLQVIVEQVDAYKKIPQMLDQHRKQIEGELGSYKRHPLIDIKEHLRAIEAAFENAKTALAAQQDKHPNLLEADSILDAITQLFDGQIGMAYDESALKSLHKDGEHRYSLEIPPGYADAKDKRGDEKYGDLVIWRQMLDRAEATKAPMILVTDDSKEDWWWRFQGKTLGPRPELVEEMRSIAGVDFYMYRTDQFMQHARLNLREQISEETINEVRTVRRNAAVTRRIRERVYAEKLAMAEQMQDLLNRKTALEQRQKFMDRRLEDVADIEQHFDLHKREARDIGGLQQHRELIAERIRIEHEQGAINAELAALSAEISKITAAVSAAERHANRVGLGDDQADKHRLLTLDF